MTMAFKRLIGTRWRYDMTDNRPSKPNAWLAHSAGLKGSIGFALGRIGRARLQTCQAPPMSYTHSCSRFLGRTLAGSEFWPCVGPEL